MFLRQYINLAQLREQLAIEAVRLQIQCYLKCLE